MATKTNLKTIALVAIGVLLGNLLGPVAATATTSLVTLFDPRSDSRARIDNGELRIGDGAGALTVDGNVSAATAHDRRQLVNRNLQWSNSGSSVHTPSYTVPDGKRLVVTSVSLRAHCLGDGAERVELAQFGAGESVVWLALTDVMNSGVITYQTGTHDIDLASGPGQLVYFVVGFRGDCDLASAFGSFHGYLVPV